MPRKKKGTDEQPAEDLGQTVLGPGAAKRITPIEIQQKEFRLSMRGYNEREVDQFLDEVTEEMARLYAENKRLREEVELRGPGAGPFSGDAEAMVRRAEEEAARILSQAEERARVIGAGGEAPGAGGATVSALGPYLTREREFLKSVAELIQRHAEAVREDVRRTREARGSAPTAGAAPESPPGPEEPARADAGSRAEAPRSFPVPAATPEAQPPASPPAPPAISDGPGPVPVDSELADTRPGDPVPSGSAPDRAEQDRSLRELFWGED